MTKAQAEEVSLGLLKLNFDNEVVNTVESIYAVKFDCSINNILMVHRYLLDRTLTYELKVKLDKKIFKCRLI